MILGTDVRLESPNPTPRHVASPELKCKPRGEESGGRFRQSPGGGRFRGGGKPPDGN